jgi:RHS repeat-associated protein
VIHSPTHIAAARHYFPSSAANPRSNLVAHRHALTRVTTACRVNTSLRTAAPRARHDHLKTYHYDASDRLSRVDTPQSGQTLKTHYWHNAAGQRIFKSEPSAATSTQTVQLGAIYVYADPGADNQAGLPSWAILAERSNGGANLTRNADYIWLPLEDGSAIPVAIYTAGRYYNIHSDHLGTPRLITDDTATPVWQWPYSAFGETKPTGLVQITGSGATQSIKGTTATFEFNLRYPGQYADSETGQFYNYYRNYLAAQGRYTQNDPIGLAGGINRQIYVSADPLGRIDPLGLSESCGWLAKALGWCDPTKLPEKICEAACDSVEERCKRAVAPSCYWEGTPCLAPWVALGKQCRDEQKKRCNTSQSSTSGVCEAG